MVGANPELGGDSADSPAVGWQDSSWKDSSWAQLILLLAIGLLVGLALLQSPGTDDRAQWLVYMDTARHNGLLATYRIAAITGVGVNPTDYPPLALVLLWLFARLAQALGASDFLVLKFSLLAFTLGCAAVMAAWRGIMFGIAIYLLLAIDAFLLTYLDVYFLLTFLLALWCLERNRLAAGAALFTVSLLTKWQPIILGPLIFLYVMRRPYRLTNLLQFVPAVLILLAVDAAFANVPFTAFLRGASDPRFSGKALNVDWLITALSETGGQLAARGGTVRSIVIGELPGGIYPQLALVSSVLRYICYLIAVAGFYLSKRSVTDFVQSAILCFASYFMFGGGVHENHACLAAVLALCWMALDRARYVEATLLGAMFNINIVVFYGFTGNGLSFSYVLGGFDITILLALFNLIVFAVLWLPVARTVIWRRPPLASDASAAP